MNTMLKTRNHHFTQNPKGALKAHKEFRKLRLAALKRSIHFGNSKINFNVRTFEMTQSKVPTLLEQYQSNDFN